MRETVRIVLLVRTATGLGSTVPGAAAAPEQAGPGVSGPAQGAPGV